MEDFYREQNVEVMIADWTSYDSQITEYLNSFNRAGVPLYVFYQKVNQKYYLKYSPKILFKAQLKIQRSFNEIY